jgi:hypothetical protein
VVSSSFQRFSVSVFQFFSVYRNGPDCLCGRDVNEMQIPERFIHDPPRWGQVGRARRSRPTGDKRAAPYLLAARRMPFAT